MADEPYAAASFPMSPETGVDALVGAVDLTSSAQRAELLEYVLHEGAGSIETLQRAAHDLDVLYANLDEGFRSYEVVDSSAQPQVLTEFRTAAQASGIPQAVIDRFAQHIESDGGITVHIRAAHSTLNDLTTRNKHRIQQLESGIREDTDAPWDPHDIHKVECGLSLAVTAVGLKFPPLIGVGVAGMIAYCVPALLEE
jgi:hypothetical protein